MTRRLLPCFILVGVVACDFRAPLTGDEVIVCSEASPRCPSSLRCVVAVERCLPADSPCIADDDTPAADGSACATSDGVAGVCAAAQCIASRCGDGRVDATLNEVCDDGAVNRAGWGEAPGCLDDCSGPAPVCGDGRRDAEEACDDGYTDACGTCAATCQATGPGDACGDGVVCLELEACDDGGPSVACNADCTPSSCGDGVVNAAAGEVCDDGADNDDGYARARHCNATCAGPGRFCGDRVVDLEEQCDEEPSAACGAGCAPPGCGDGVVQTELGEACDTDGPSASCTAACQPRKTLSVGFNHTCVVDDGEARCFGGNENGECGDNPPLVGAPLSTMGGNLRPLPVDGDVIGVAVGLRFTCALLADGRVACFGCVNVGLGDTDGDGDFNFACFGDTDEVRIGDGTPYVDIGGRAVDLTAGRDHVCALRDDNTVVCWGGNFGCSAGAGHDRRSVGVDPAELGAALVPVSLVDRQVTSIAAGDAFTCALFVDGAVQCWGNGDDGVLGLGDREDRGCVAGEPAQFGPIDLPAPVASLGVSGRSACAILTTGKTACWGFNSDGRLGQGIADIPSLPSFRRGIEPLQMGDNIPQTPLGDVPPLRLTPSGAGGSFCVLLRDGGVKCWGNNVSGALGLGDERSRGAAPSDLGSALPRVDLGVGVRAIDVVAGAGGACARLESGAIKCWGQHTSGAGVGEAPGAGLGRPLAFPIGDGPGEMGDALPVVALSAACGNGIVEDGEACDDGFKDTCGSCNASCTDTGIGAVCGDGRLCPELELCDPARDADCSPACVSCGDGRCLGVCAADVCGDGFVCEGREVCDGDSGCTADCAAGVATVHGGAQSTCVVDAEGVARCFGNLGDEQLGAKTLVHIANATDARPVNLGATRRIRRLARSRFSQTTCAVTTDDGLVCWGDNSTGQLGSGDTADRGDDPARMGDALPTVSLGTGFRVKDAAVGTGFACAVSVTGLVKCWGRNDLGQLGQGVAVPQIGAAPGELGDALPPIRLGEGVRAVAVSAGHEHVCALDDAGRVRCWGSGRNGILGRGDERDVGADAALMVDGLPPVDLGTDGAGPRRAVAVRAGVSETCAIVDATAQRPRELVCWGQASSLLGAGRTFAGPVGDSPDELGDSLVGVDFGGPTPVDMCISSGSACALLDTGAVRCWGGNSLGMLGFLGRSSGSQRSIGDEPGELAAFPDVPLAGPADGVSCGDEVRCAHLVGGGVSCWGRSPSGAHGAGLLRAAPGQDEEDTVVVAGAVGAPMPVLPLP